MELASGEVLPADVVIDCSGRFSSTPNWLQEAGWQAPPVQKVDAHVVYSSRHYKRPQGWDKVGCCAVQCGVVPCRAMLCCAAL